MAREALLGSGDIPGDLDEVVNRYSSWFPTGLDTSAFDKVQKEGWYLNTISDSTKTEVIQRNKAFYSGDKTMARATLDVLSDRVAHRKQPLESTTEMHARWDKLTIQLEQVSNTLKQGESVGVVSHAVTFQVGTAPEGSKEAVYDPNTTWIAFEEASIYPDNAQLFALDKYIL